MTAAGPVEAWIVDDTGFPKKGRHSVGVARQYCGQLGVNAEVNFPRLGGVNFPTLMVFR
jgi:SRSO17 transposase